MIETVITCSVNHVKFLDHQGSTLKCQKGIYGTIPTVISDELDQVEYGSRGGTTKKMRKEGSNGKKNLIQTALCIGSFG